MRAGKLRIADHWNAISIIAKSQTNPLKAVAEFVENSIDARAKQIVIVRGKKKGEFYLKISDDGEGIARDNKGLPDFRRVATHIFYQAAVQIRGAKWDPGRIRHRSIKFLDSRPES
jgi:hypothetical protein